MPKRHRYRNVISAVYGTPWAILPSKLEEICALIEMRDQGLRLTKSQIRARIGAVSSPELIDPRSELVEGRNIAMFNLFGTISQRINALQEFSGGTSTEQFAKAFRHAVSDDSVAAIVINVDSPGGSVAGLPELSELIFEARGEKPIVAVANPLMASAAYWIASAADEIVAVPSATDIGSIGVVTIHTDQSGADEQAGLSRTILSSAERKADGNRFEPLSERARLDIEDKIGAIHDQFVADVARNRGVPTESVEDRFGQGATFTAREAVRRGLADRIATFEEVIEDLGASVASGSNRTRISAERRAFAISTSPPRTEQGRMNPKLKNALVQAGLIKADDADNLAEVALTAWLAARDLQRPEDDAEALTLFEQHRQPPAQPAKPAPAAAVQSNIEAADILAAVGMTSLSAEEKNELSAELVKQADSLSYSAMLDRINERVREHNAPAGAERDAVSVTVSETDKFQAAARDAILARTWGAGNLPQQVFDFRTREMIDWSPGANLRNYGLMSLPKLAQQVLIQCGMPVSKVFNLSNHDVARLVMGADPHSLGLGGVFAAADGPAYNVSGMFSNILLDAANVMLRRSYDDARTTFQVWMRQGPSVEDFKTVNKVIAGELNDPKAVPEDGEFEETSLSDGKETYKLTVWGSIFSHSWQLVVNDRLNSFAEIPTKLGKAHRRKQNRLAYNVLKDNNALADGNNLFDSTNHSNDTTSGGAPSVANLNTMTQNMMEQTGLDADSGRLNIMPRYLVHAPSNRGTVLELLGSVANPAGTHAGVINIWQSGLEPVTEGELSTAAGGTDAHYFLAADSAEVDTIEYAYLQGLETPVIEQEVAFSSLALRQRIYQAFAVAALDHRGLQRHTGAA